jgi:hypothetical protein
MSAPITVTFNAGGTPAGFHTGDLCVVSNDPIGSLHKTPVALTLWPYYIFPIVRLNR